MNSLNFLRLVAAIPENKIANPDYNIKKINQLWDEIEAQQADIVVFPELAISGYSCGELFKQKTLYENSMLALGQLLVSSENKSSILIIGSYLNIDNVLYNCAFVIYKGSILSIIPKVHLPNKQEFYEKRWFSSGKDLNIEEVNLFNKTIPIGNIILREENGNFSFSTEICEDLWAPIPPSSLLYLQGAELIFNLSASTGIVGKSDYRKSLISQQSARFNGAYIYTSAGVHESSTDSLMDGHAIIAENGLILSENERFQRRNNYIVKDIDMDLLKSQRLNNSSFKESVNLIHTSLKIRRINFSFKVEKKKNLKRHINKKPFIPEDPANMKKVCENVFNIQAGALATRMENAKIKKAVIGISGGLDSTLAFLATIRAFEILKLPLNNIIAITMPGFGTTRRTYSNSKNLIQSYCADFREIDIRKACTLHFEMIGHDPSIHDVTYENVQARERTEILMNIANKEGGLVIGTGDLSELALGWCTYNGDHMSMYSLNCGIPKTLVKYLVKYFADKQSDKDENIKQILYSILETPISPELLPLDSKGNSEQKTEDTLGPYIVHDFFLYNFIKYGYNPDKLLFLSKEAFKNEYTEEKLTLWLKLFIRRFFTQQFKRSCLPDGPKIGSIGLSPRGDWKMPSDADFSIWLKNI